MESDIHNQILLYGFLIAVVMGAVANKTNFCTMGAVSDWINMGKKGRLYAWFTAIAVAIIGVQALQYSAGLSLSNTLPPYHTALFAWSRYILGGFLFGIGMTLAGGCGNKTLLNIGGGNLKSLFVLVVAAIFAYLMTKTDFYGVLFHPWVNGTAIDLQQLGIPTQTFGDILTGGSAAGTVNLIAAAVLVIGILFFALRDKNYRTKLENPIAGIVIGLCIVAGWYVTGGEMGREWIAEVEWLDNKPLSVTTQSYTFINPMGETAYYLMDPTNLLRVTFGVLALAGVIVGSFLMSLITRRFKFVWFKDRNDFINHSIGAVLMGIGGVLGMGCTIGQGITGMSTLALGSLLVLVSIIFGSALTMKIQYYKMMYDEEATFMASLLSSLCDMKLLPESIRKLETP